MEAVEGGHHQRPLHGVHGHLLPLQRLQERGESRGYRYRQHCGTDWPAVAWVPVVCAHVRKWAGRIFTCTCMWVRTRVCVVCRANLAVPIPLCCVQKCELTSLRIQSLLSADLYLLIHLTAFNFSFHPCFALSHIFFIPPSLCLSLSTSSASSSSSPSSSRHTSCLLFCPPNSDSHGAAAPSSEDYLS